MPPPFIQVLDANRDGAIDADEMANAATALKPLDKDGDGKVTREETSNAPWFDKLDRNQDGVITREEVLAVAAQVKKFALDSGLNFSPPAARVKPVAQGPKILKGGDLGVGRQVADVSFTDLTGKA